jgi:hypothetical protein
LNPPGEEYREVVGAARRVGAIQDAGAIDGKGLWYGEDGVQGVDCAGGIDLFDNAVPNVRDVEVIAAIDGQVS